MISDVVEVDTSRNGNRIKKNTAWTLQKYSITQGALVQSHLPGDQQMEHDLSTQCNNLMVQKNVDCPLKGSNCRLNHDLFLSFLSMPRAIQRHWHGIKQTASNSQSMFFMLVPKIVALGTWKTTKIDHKRMLKPRSFHLFGWIFPSRAFQFIRSFSPI